MDICGEIKKEINTISIKNSVINNIIKVIASKDNFLIAGHIDPDDDCVASMIALSLVIRKFSKQVSIVLYKDYQHKFPYLVKIGNYNGINIIESENQIEESYPVIIALDTPKLEMLDGGKKLKKLIANDTILKMEIDHHLGGDSKYIGDKEYCLVDEASSTCELIGYLTCKLSNNTKLIEANHIPPLFSRNFVLAIITGMVGDSQMGEFLKSHRQKRRYNYFSTLFNKLLLKETNINSNNFSDMKDVYKEQQTLSEEEEKIFEAFMKLKQKSQHIFYIILDRETTEKFMSNYKEGFFVSAARRVADRLAEESGYFSLVAYYNNKKELPIIQFRMRRNQSFKDIDLRDIIADAGIIDGGGHPGAVAFRIKQSEIDNIDSFSRDLVSKIEVSLSKKISFA